MYSTTLHSYPFFLLFVFYNCPHFCTRPQPSLFFHFFFSPFHAVRVPFCFPRNLDSGLYLIPLPIRVLSALLLYNIADSHRAFFFYGDVLSFRADSILFPPLFCLFPLGCSSAFFISFIYTMRYNCSLLPYCVRSGFDPVSFPVFFWTWRCFGSGVYIFFQDNV